MALSAQNVFNKFLAVATSYGTTIITLVIFLVFVQFILAAIYKVYREHGTALTQAERLAWYKAYWYDYEWLNATIATFTLVSTLSSFTVYKSVVIGAEGYGFDLTFAAWDQLFFAGNDAWVVTHSIFDTATATMWIDVLYHPTFFPMVIVYLLAITATNRPFLRQTYMLAYLASWFVTGMVAANALHSAGPVYDGILFGDGTTFAPLIERLNAQLTAGGGPVTAVPIQKYLLQLQQNSEIRFGGGISAMPSMHMVLVFLLIFLTWNLSHTLGIITILYACIIWIGSVHLGWHYFVDGLVSLMITGVIWRLAGRIVGLYPAFPK